MWNVDNYLLKVSKCALSIYSVSLFELVQTKILIIEFYFLSLKHCPIKFLITL